MLQDDASVSGFARTFEATYAAVDDVCDALIAALSPVVSDRELFFIRLLLYEALTNAVRHGCGGDPTQYVTCEASWDADALHLTIADSGAGFDWQAALERDPSDTACSGRGLVILRLYATRVAFNAVGNVLTVTYRFKGGANERL